MGRSVAGFPVADRLLLFLKIFSRYFDKSSFALKNGLTFWELCMTDNKGDSGEGTRSGTLSLLSVISDSRGVPHLIAALYVEGDSHEMILVFSPRDIGQVPMSVREKMGLSCIDEDADDEEDEEWGNFATGYGGLAVFSACQDEEGSWFMAVGEDAELNALEEDGGDEVGLWVFGIEDQPPPEINRALDRVFSPSAPPVVSYDT